MATLSAYTIDGKDDLTLDRSLTLEKIGWDHLRFHLGSKNRSLPILFLTEQRIKKWVKDKTKDQAVRDDMDAFAESKGVCTDGSVTRIEIEPHDGSGVVWTITPDGASSAQAPVPGSQDGVEGFEMSIQTARHGRGTFVMGPSLYPPLLDHYRDPSIPLDVDVTAPDARSLIYSVGNEYRNATGDIWTALQGFLQGAGLSKGGAITSITVKSLAADGPDPLFFDAPGPSSTAVDEGDSAADTPEA